ncbi:PepSY domain-containing protein [Breoghania sp.]|uniref:PepSY domain-containing protein n=1 Tax=Breoghania sp. TaxID=2065378 RepID=UPI0026136371|nr:PepSY domain-containing protein [Breoghania sp.]MDJ0931840.1 PepSY domain-containing protein [Breoghania sp.]
MREAVRAGEAKPLGPVMREIGGGEIVRTMLCRTPHGLVYLIAVLNGSRVEKMIVDAETGRILHWH